MLKCVNTAEFLILCALLFSHNLILCLLNNQERGCPVLKDDKKKIKNQTWAALVWGNITNVFFCHTAFKSLSSCQHTADYQAILAQIETN